MGKFAFRIVISLVSSLVLARLGVSGNTSVLQTLFTVLGILFSISMSLLVSLDLSKVINNRVRIAIRASIGLLRGMLLADFSLSTIALVTALVWDKDNYINQFMDGWIIVDVPLTALCLISMSLIYEAYNFKRLHDLHCDIEDRLIKETRNHNDIP